MAVPATPPLGWVRVYAIDPPLSITARMSDERPNVDTGYGGWDEIARPRRSPLTTFRGSPALHLTLPLLLDKFVSGDSIEREISAVTQMGLPTAADGEPPRLHVRARGGAVPYQGRTWVLNDIVWGDAEMNTAGDRTRQQFTLSLAEYIEDVHLREKSSAARRRAKVALVKTKRGASSKRVTAKKGRAVLKKPSARSLSTASTTTFGDGEDLLTIAARELGDADRWVEIAALNNLRDPRSISEGQVLRLP
jgi:hypothetical protein